jgi:hypothetical protein
MKYCILWLHIARGRFMNADHLHKTCEMRVQLNRLTAEANKHFRIRYQHFVCLY